MRCLRRRKQAILQPRLWPSAGQTGGAHPAEEALSQLEERWLELEMSS